jgi:hypothetical protein
MKRRHRWLAITITLAAVAAPFIGTGTASAYTARVSSSSVRANTQEQDCYPGNSNWVHIYMADGNDQCFGRTGSTPLNPSEPEAIGFCGGNNTGYISGVNANGSPVTVHFAPGTAPYYFPPPPYAGGQFPGGVYYPYSVTITKWGGSDGCPT